MAITRADLLKQILPGLNALFDIEYTKHSEMIFGMELNMDEHTVEVNFDENANIRNNDSNE
jgi:hypothetical protein